MPSWTDTGDILFLDPPKISWTRSVCKAIDYPCFTHESAIDRFLPYSDLDPAFSGLIAYDCNFSLEAHEKPERALLKITAAGEDVELFLNGVSLGIQVLQPFVWDVTANLRPENNHLRVEVATTLERETGANPENQAPTGLFGHVQLILQKGGQKNG